MTADRLTIISQVGWLELEEPFFIQIGERYRVDWDARTVIVEGLDDAERIHPSKPSGPDSIR